MAVGLWAVALEPAQQRESGARRSHSAGGSWGSYEPSLAGLEASMLKLQAGLHVELRVWPRWELRGVGQFVVRALLGRDRERKESSRRGKKAEDSQEDPLPNNFPTLVCPRCLPASFCMRGVSCKKSLSFNHRHLNCFLNVLSYVAKLDIPRYRA